MFVSTVRYGMRHIGLSLQNCISAQRFCRSKEHMPTAVFAVFTGSNLMLLSLKKKKCKFL